MYTGGTSYFYSVSLPPECKDLIYGRRKEKTEEESGGRRYHVVRRQADEIKLHREQPDLGADGSGEVW